MLSIIEPSNRAKGSIRSVSTIETSNAKITQRSIYRVSLLHLRANSFIFIERIQARNKERLQPQNPLHAKRQFGLFTYQIALLQKGMLFRN